MRPRDRFRARNVLTGEVCGHNHHTAQKARCCIVHYGWRPQDCVIEVFRGSEGRMKRSLHHRNRLDPRGSRQEEYRGETCQPKRFKKRFRSIRR